MVGAARDAVDVLVVADLLLVAGDILPVLDDGESDVRLESQELTAHVVEGDCYQQPR